MEQLPVPPSVLRSSQSRSVGGAGVTFGGRDEIGRGVTRRRNQRHRERGPKRGSTPRQKRPQPTSSSCPRFSPKCGNQISPSG